MKYLDVTAVVYIILTVPLLLRHFTTATSYVILCVTKDGLLDLHLSYGKQRLVEISLANADFLHRLAFTSTTDGLHLVRTVTRDGLVDNCISSKSAQDIASFTSTFSKYSGNLLKLSEADVMDVYLKLSKTSNSFSLPADEFRSQSNMDSFVFPERNDSQSVASFPHFGLWARMNTTGTGLFMNMFRTRLQVVDRTNECEQLLKTAAKAIGIVNKLVDADENDTGRLPTVNKTINTLISRRHFHRFVPNGNNRENSGLYRKRKVDPLKMSNSGIISSDMSTTPSGYKIDDSGLHTKQEMYLFTISTSRTIPLLDDVATPSSQTQESSGMDWKQEVGQFIVSTTGKIHPLHARAVSSDGIHGEPGFYGKRGIDSLRKSNSGILTSDTRAISSDDIHEESALFRRPEIDPPKMSSSRKIFTSKSHAVSMETDYSRNKYNVSSTFARDRLNTLRSVDNEKVQNQNVNKTQPPHSARVIFRSSINLLKLENATEWGVLPFVDKQLGKNRHVGRHRRQQKDRNNQPVKNYEKDEQVVLDRQSSAGRFNRTDVSQVADRHFSPGRFNRTDVSQVADRHFKSQKYNESDLSYVTVAYRRPHRRNVTRMRRIAERERQRHHVPDIHQDLSENHQSINSYRAHRYIRQRQTFATQFDPQATGNKNAMFYNRTDRRGSENYHQLDKYNVSDRLYTTSMLHRADRLGASGRHALSGSIDKSRKRDINDKNRVDDTQNSTHSSPSLDRRRGLYRHHISDRHRGSPGQYTSDRYHRVNRPSFLERHHRAHGYHGSDRHHTSDRHHRLARHHKPQRSHDPDRHYLSERHRKSDRHKTHVSDESHTHIKTDPDKESHRHQAADRNPESDRHLDTSSAQRGQLSIYTSDDVSTRKHEAPTGREGERARAVDAETVSPGGDRDRSKRDLFTGWMIFPGTKWCGDGDIAEHKRDMGYHSELDTCCRRHDLCPLVIPRLTWKYGIFNYRLHTLSHCRCDRKLRKCLHALSSPLAHLIGQIYFNVIGPECFKFTQKTTCVQRHWWGGCQGWSVSKVAYSKRQRRFK